MRKLLSRIGWVVGLGPARPPVNDSTLFRGRYALKDQSVTGWVRRPEIQVARPPASIVVSHCGKVIGATSEFAGGDREWHFTYDTGFTITTADVLQEHFTVVAVSNTGARFELRPEGGMQLKYIRNAHAPDSEIELTIEFDKSGNARTYLRDGWYNSEAKHTWTKGVESFMEIPVKRPRTRYRLELSLRPFIVPDRLPEQRLDIYLNGCLVSRSSLRPGSREVKCDIPEDLIPTGSMMLRFDHPDAARPCDLIPERRDDRLVAIAFQVLLLRSILEAGARSEA